MNTRSSTARKRQMTVDFSSRHAEGTSCVAVCQSSIDESVADENSIIENDLKKSPIELCVDYDEEASKTNKSHDQSFGVKEDLTFSSGVTTRSSCRPCKRPRTISPPRSVSATPESTKSAEKRLKSSNKPQRRQWESWAPKEKDCFFEALLEHSKDFDKIHNYLMNVHKRRGDLSAVVRNKDQVRHFYYRTLNKIAKYIPEPADPLDSKKTNHEVRSLICYGELRKRFRSLKEKDGKKLTELISTGKTTIRHRGRNWNIRAPVCRALKKNANVVLEEPEHVPNKIMVELIPSDNKAWSTVQSLAQNPRLRTTVSSRKSLPSLLTFLLSKWKLSSDTNVTLSPSAVHSCFNAVINKGKDSGTVAKYKQSCDDINNQGAEEERECDSFEVTKDRSNGRYEVMTEAVAVSLPDSSNEPKAETNYGDVKEQEDTKRDDVQEILNQGKWNLSNCSGVTIADLYRQLGRPRKIALSYSFSTEDTTGESSTIRALEHLVRLAAGEFRCRTDVKTAHKKDPVSIPSCQAKSVSNDSVIVSKPSKVPKPSVKFGLKPPKLAPKPQEPSLVIPAVVPSIINKVSTNVSARSGNHLTFGFTPINSFQRPSPFLPMLKKSQKSRVVVQRTLLPRPCTEPASSVSSLSVVSSPRQISSGGGSVSSTQSPLTLSPAPSPRQILPKEDGLDLVQEGAFAKSLPSSTSPDPGFSVESLINFALEQDIPGDAGKVLSSVKTNDHSGSLNVDRNSRNRMFTTEATDNVCTEEIDCGVAGGVRTIKEASSLVEAIEHLGNNKGHLSVEHTQDLLDNFKSPDDEDPFKLLSPTHVQQFHPESWLNEESSDFSLSNLFANMEGSPVKQKNSILDTPKKNQSDVKVPEHTDVHDRYSNSESVFCGMVDESSVDYVKKFRDLAKKMTNDTTETVPSSFSVNESLPSSSSNSTVSFKAFLSDTTSMD